MDYGVLLSTYEREIGREAAVRMPQQHRLYACLRAAILSGKIEEGTQLLASRTLAEELSMARNSVLYAYERLASEGFVVGRRQGTVVARVGVPQAPAAVPGDAPVLSRRVAHIERPGEGMDDPLPFLPGTPALDAFPLAQWRRSVERAWRNIGPAQLGYMPVEGNAALRQAIAEYLRVSRGVRCEAGQVFVTDGTQNSLDLCARTLADAGDTAWIENPGYLGARHAFQAAGPAAGADPHRCRRPRAASGGLARSSAQADLHHAVAPVPARRRDEPGAAAGAAGPGTRGRRVDHRR